MKESFPLASAVIKRSLLLHTSVSSESKKQQTYPRKKKTEQRKLIGTHSNNDSKTRLKWAPTNTLQNTTQNSGMHADPGIQKRLRVSDILP
uniref:Uncharacterized protein n=1 Tax=Nelumbo nucifera TaxID=4432 RepID=A0A822Z1X1_NELNU|nr:TPA_asm: hypothetical protein HUJ06_008110 [Nelumbo nucifera]